MLIATPAKFRRRGRIIQSAAPPKPPGAALVLVLAYYDENLAQLTLVFDRAIKIPAFNGSAITVVDGSYDMFIYNGDGPVFIFDGSSVQIPLVITGDYNVDGVRLTAGADTGIIAVNDGGTWPGVTNLILPYEP